MSVPGGQALPTVSELPAHWVFETVPSGCNTSGMRSATVNGAVSMGLVCFGNARPVKGAPTCSSNFDFYRSHRPRTIVRPSRSGLHPCS